MKFVRCMGRVSGLSAFSFLAKGGLEVEGFRVKRGLGFVALNPKP